MSKFRPARFQNAKLLDEGSIGLALLLAGLGAVLLLVPGLLTDAGPAPLRVLFGWGAPVVAVALVAGGVVLTITGRFGWQVRWPAVAAGELLFLTLLTVLHLAAGRTDGLWATALAGRAGGLVGWAIGQLLVDLIGATGAILVTSAGAMVAAWWLWRSLPATWTGLVGALLWQGVHRLSRVDEQPSAQTSEPTGATSRSAPSRAGPRGVSATPRSRPVAPDTAVTRPPPAPKQDRERTRPPSQERAARPKPRPSSLPPLEILRPDGEHPADRADARQRAQLLKQTLADFGVPVEIVSIKEGPTVTQFGLEPGEIIHELHNGEVVRRRVPVSRIMRLSNDLALALAAASIRIEAPVPGRPYVGVEIPNTQKTLVSLRNILESREFARVNSPLAVALGRDVSGDPVVADLGRMPHLLIAGATGSGKSVCINAIVCSLLMNNGPERLRFLMVDPKMVELPAYNGIPHLLAPVVTDLEQVPGALAWLTLQMDDRYRIFAERGVRNIDEYNRKIARSRPAGLMPYIILVIDEMADLMMTATYDVERQICRLAQMSRATGIHLVLATQRPSVDVITGLIKANFPARIAFAVTAQVDSRVILDAPGAEKLLGRGDMLFMAPDSPQLVRIQGCFVSDREIDRLVAFWENSQPADERGQPATLPWADLLEQMEQKDDLLEQALQFIQTKSQVSTSLLQRHLRIGYPRAARLMEQLEEMGAVGPDEGAGRSRAVLVRHEDAVEQT